MEKFKRESYRYFLCSGTTIRKIIELLSKENPDHVLKNDEEFYFEKLVPLTKEQIIENLEQEISNLKFIIEIEKQKNLDNKKRLGYKVKRLTKLKNEQ